MWLDDTSCNSVFDLSYVYGHPNTAHRYSILEHLCIIGAHFIHVTSPFLNLQHGFEHISFHPMKLACGSFSRIPNSFPPSRSPSEPPSPLFIHINVCWTSHSLLPGTLTESAIVSWTLTLGSMNRKGELHSWFFYDLLL